MPTVQIPPLSSSATGAALTMPMPGVVRFPENLKNVRFERCLDRSACGELWQVATYDGSVLLAWLLNPGQHSELWNDLNRVQRLSLPGLAQLHIVAEEGNRPVLLYPYPELTLLDRFHQLRKRGQPGVPRDELLGYLRKLAPLLDEVHCQRMYHLGLHPRWVFLPEEPDDRLAKEVEPLLAGFGFVQHAWLPTGQPLPAAHGRYAAPELAQNLAGPRCDQYSLALMYAEMRTGVFPLKEGSRDRRNFLQAREAPFDFTFMGSAEGKVLARALDPEPARRFDSCQDLVQALDNTVCPHMSMMEALETPGGHGQPWQPPTGRGRKKGRGLDAFVNELVHLTAPGWAWDTQRRIRYRLEPGRQLEHQLLVEEKAGDPTMTLRDFCQQWGAPFQTGVEGAVLLTVVTSSSFWQRLVGRKVGLQVEVLWERFPVEGKTHGELRVVLRPYGCGPAEARRHLEEKGPELLESLRDYLGAKAEQRTQVRVPYHRPVQVQPVVDAMHVGQPIHCVGKDISTGGIGFFLPSTVKASQVVIHLEDARVGDGAVGIAQIVRRQACGEGWFEVGAKFGPGG